MKTSVVYTLDFNEITLKDLARVGGKNASLGELFNALKPQGVNVLDGFATTADAYRVLLAQGDLEYQLRSLLDFDVEDVRELAIRGTDVRRQRETRIATLQAMANQVPRATSYKYSTVIRLAQTI